MRLGNKVTRAHLEWTKQKMKVSLATQLFSCGAANAMDHLNNNMGNPIFAGSEATVAFFRHMNDAFDVLNSRNIFGKGSKAPMNKDNFQSHLKILNDCKEFLLGLTDASGVPMHQGPRKTGFLGLIISMQSYIRLHERLVLAEDAPLTHLLAYKFSQDHLELFFSAVRSRGGFNNNPSARQFKSAYKRLLMRHHVKHNVGNCLYLDETTILHVNGEGVSTVDLAWSDPVEEDHDYAALPVVEDVSEFKEAVINYISGFIVR